MRKRAAAQLVVVLGLAAASEAVAGPLGVPDLEAPALAAGPGGLAPLVPLDPNRCVSDEQIAAAQRAANPEAFGDSAIPLGPLFWASRDRTFMQVMLVYWRYLGVEDRTKLEVTFPFWLSSCTPQADTTVGPLATFGWKTDQKGTAGYYGPYFFRRDNDAESDVLFPFYWHLVDAKGSSLITPLFASWGNNAREESHLWVLQTWANRTTTSWDVASWPVFFAGEATDGNHHMIIPPLLFAQWGDGMRETTLVGQTWFLDEGKGGWDAGSLPFYIGGRHGDSYYDLSPLFARWGNRDEGNFLSLQTLADWDDNHWSVNSIPFYFGGESKFGGKYHHLIPPLLTFIWGDDEKKDVIAGPYWDLESPHKFDQGIFPVFARGADDTSSYFLTPLFGAWGGKNDSHVWVLQTIADVDETAHSWDVRSYPFYFGGEDGRGGYHHDVPLALTFIWGDPTHQNIVAGPWLDLSAGASPGAHSHDAALLPLYFEGQVHGERPPLAELVEGTARFFGGTDHVFGNEFHYRVLPPLLYAHAGNEQIEDTVFLQSWLFREKAPALSPSSSSLDGAWDAGSFPFYAGGRHGDGYYDLTPVFARWGDDLHHTLLAGPYFDIDTPSGDDHGLFPLYFSGATKALRGDDAYHYRIIPLLYEHWGDADRERTLFLQSWLFRNDAGVDDDGKERWDAGSFPFYAGGRHGNDYYDLSPLFARWGDATDHHFLAGPYFDIESAGGEDQGIFPLYFAGAAKNPHDGFHYRIIPLLYEHWGDADRERTLFLQSWLFRSDAAVDDDGKERWDAGSFPFYAGGRHGDAFYDLTPVFARWGDANESHLVAGPVFDIQSKGGEDYGLFPLYFAGEAKSKLDGFHYRAIPLLYEHWGDAAHENTLFLQSWLFRTEGAARDGVVGGWDAGSFPFYAGGASDDGDFYNVTPVGALWGDTARTHLWALQTFAGWGEHRWDIESFPVYFGGADDDTGEYGHAIVPALTFAWGDRDDHNLVVGPFYRFDRGLESTPALRASSSSVVASAAPPTPNFDEGVFPLYARGADAGGSYFGIPALLTIAWSNGRDDNLIAGPVFNLNADGGRINAHGLFPLYGAGQFADDFHWRLAPELLYAHVGYDKTEATVFAQSWWFHDDRSWNAGSFPFYAGGVSPEGYYQLTPVFSMWGDEHRTHIASLQTLAAWGDHRWDVESFPFYFGGADDDTGDYGHAIVPLLTAAWGNAQRHEMNWWTAQTFVHVDDQAWSAVSVPFFFGWGDKSLDEDTEWVLPPAYMHWHTPEDDATLLLAYYARNSKNGTSAHALAPIWFAGNDRERYWNVVAPAYFGWGTASHDEERWLFLPTLTYGSRVHGEDWLLAPLVWHEKTPERDDTIVFPLWWSFNDDAGKALVVSGVWWDLQWPHEGKHLQLAPGYLRWEDNDEAFTIAGPLSWSEGKGDHKEAWSFHVFPLFSVWSYHPGHIRWRALIGAFGYEEEKTAQRTRREVMVMGLKFDPG